jgi:dTDP-glucose pyrophosphorylase
MEKVVVLAAGLGTRMRAGDEADLTDEQRRAADGGVKAMVPIDRPFLDYVLSTVADAGVRHACLVIGPTHDEIRAYYESVATERLTFDFAVQPEPLGTANALTAARDFAAGDDILVINADNHYPLQAVQGLAALDGPGLVGFDSVALTQLGNIPAERIARFAVIDTDDDGCLRRVVEKPSPEWLARQGERVAVSMNCWRFDQRIFTACDAIEPSERGEWEIPIAAQHAVDHLGMRLRVVPVAAAVLDMTSRGDIDGVTRRLRGVTVRL